MLSQPAFADRLLAWFDQHGRHGLPWQNPRTPYRVWLSEVMLQQTQVSTVIGYFERFISHFPDVQTLACAEPDAVMAQWAGLGYYSRARNLHACAKQIVARFSGVFPHDIAELMSLPGIGQSTAGAIAAQAFEQRTPILDANVKRVLARQIALREDPNLAASRAALWQHARDLLPEARLADYTQAIMDLGATLCTARNPRCAQCPVRNSCEAHRLDVAAELPVRAAKRAIPQRESAWLLARDEQDRWLFERRPDIGIWGGLYALPEFDSAELQNAVSQRDLLLLEPARALQPIQHQFTHFTLIATPWLLRVRELSSAREASQRWVSQTELATLGMPAPVKALMNTVG